MDRVTSAKIKKNLNSQVIGRDIYCYEILKSTNFTAKERADCAEGSVFIADEQTAGRGRLSRKWSSEKGVGIYMSVLLKPDLPAEEVPCITLICGLAVCRALRAAGAAVAGIKWSNDILINGKKICGVLTERLPNGEIVAGIGVNVNNSEFEGEIADIATSLYIETGKRYERAEIIALILNELDVLYREFVSGGFSAVREEYIACSVTLGKNVRIITPQEEYMAEAVGIAENGGLEIIRDQKRQTITSGEISVKYE